jgi:hypothetical protein
VTTSTGVTSRQQKCGYCVNRKLHSSGAELIAPCSDSLCSLTRFFILQASDHGKSQERELLIRTLYNPSVTRTQKFALGAVAIILLAALRFYSLSDPSSKSIQLHLRLLGSSIYEYHDKWGHWPARAEDLAQTYLPARSPYWKAMLDSGTNVIVWHDDLEPDPSEHANVILVYHNRRLLARTGRQWVCWGDLRTSYIPSKELRAKLRTR